jgi:hypothetical protein
MATATKKKKRKEEAYPWKASTSSGHTTNLKQSIFETFDIYGTVCGNKKSSIKLAPGHCQRANS